MILVVTTPTDSPASLAAFLPAPTRTVTVGGMIYRFYQTGTM